MAHIPELKAARFLPPDIHAALAAQSGIAQQYPDRPYSDFSLLLFTSRQEDAVRLWHDNRVAGAMIAGLSSEDTAVRRTVTALLRMILRTPEGVALFKELGVVPMLEEALESPLPHMRLAALKVIDSFASNFNSELRESSAAQLRAATLSAVMAVVKDPAEGIDVHEKAVHTLHLFSFTDAGKALLRKNIVQSWRKKEESCVAVLRNPDYRRGAGNYEDFNLEIMVGKLRPRLRVASHAPASVGSAVDRARKKNRGEPGVDH